MSDRGFMGVIAGLERVRTSLTGPIERQAQISDRINDAAKQQVEILDNLNKQVYKLWSQSSWTARRASWQLQKLTRPEPTQAQLAQKDFRENIRETSSDGRALALGFRAATKEFLAEFDEKLDQLKPESDLSPGNLIAAPFKLAASAIFSPIEATIFGAFQGIGENLTDSFGKGLASQIEKSSKVDFGKVGEDIGDAVGKGLQRGILDFSEMVEESIKSEGNEIAPNAGTFLKKTFDNVLMSFGRAVLAVPRGYQRMQYQRLALPQVLEQAGNMMIDNELSDEERESIQKSKSISLVVGGVNMDPTAGNTDYVNRLMTPLLQNSHIVPVKNEWSNSEYDPEFQTSFQNLVKTALNTPVLGDVLIENIKDNIRKMGKDSDFSDLTEEDLNDRNKASEKILEAFSKKDMPIGKAVEAMFKGYNPDDVKIAATALYYRQQFPDMPVNIIGTSFGGFNAAGASQMLDMLGVEGVKGAGITTPFSGVMSPPDSDNFLGSIGTEDFLYKVVESVLGQFNLTPEFQQVIEGAGRGHLLPAFIANKEFQGRFQEKFANRFNFKRGVDESSINYISKRQQNPEDENLIRTLLELAGEETDEGYTYSAEDLKGYAREIKKKSKRIKDNQLKEEVAAYLEFLDALIEDLEVVAGLKEFGISIKPNNSIKKASSAINNIKSLPLPDDSEVNQETKDSIKNFKNITAFRQKLRGEKGNFSATLAAMQGQKSDQGWAFFDGGEEFEDRFKALESFTNWLETDLLKNASDIEKGLAKPFIDFMKKLQAESQKLKDGGEFDAALIEEFEQLFGSSGEINKSLQLSSQNIQKYYAAYLQKIVDTAKKNAGNQIRTIAPNYQNLSVTQKRDFAKQFNQEIKDEVKLFRQAIESGDRNLAREIGEGLLAKIQSVKKVYSDLIDSAEDVSGRNSMQGQVGYLTAVENEIIQGQPNRRGMSNTGLTQLVGDAVEIGDDTVAGFLQSINEDVAREIGVNFGQAIQEGAQDALDINSPSKVFEWIGKQIKSGLENGLNRVGDVIRDIFDFAQGEESQIDQVVGDLIDSIQQSFSELEQQFPVIGRLKTLLLEGAKIVGSFFAAFAVGDFLLELTGLKAVFSSITSIADGSLDAAVKVESFKRTIASVTPDAQRAADSTQFLSAKVKELGTDLTVARDAYAGLTAASRFTPLQGQQTDRIFGAFSQVAALRGLTGEEQNRLFAALQQIYSKRRIGAEEAVQQLGEIPGLDFQGTLARALGVNAAQLTDKMRDNQFRIEDVLPKVAAQYEAELSSIVNSSDTALQSLNRFNNAALELKETFQGEFLPVRKFGLGIFAGLLNNLKGVVKVLTETIGKFIALMVLRFAFSLAQGGVTANAFKVILKSLLDLFLKSLPILKTFLLEFALISAAFDAVGNVITIVKNAFPELQKDIEDTTNRVEKLRTALEGVKTAAEGIQPRTDLPQNESEITTNRTWNPFGIQTPFNLEGIRQAIGWRTLGAKEMLDFQAGVGDLITGVDNNLIQQPNVQKVLDQVKELDKELDKIRSRRFNIRAGDREEYDKSIEDEQKLLEKRDQLLKATAQFQQNLQADKANVKATLEALDELAAKKGITAQSEAQIRQALESRLADIEKTSLAFENSASSVAVSVNGLELALRNLNESATYFNETIERSANNARVEFLQQAQEQGLGSQARDLGLQDIDQQLLSNRLTFLRSQLEQVNEYLSSIEFSEVLSELQSQAQQQGLNLENSATIERLLSEGRSQQENAVLNSLKTRLDLQNQIAQTGEQLQQGIISARSNLTDLNKSIEDYFFNLNQQIKEAFNEVEKLLEKLKYGDIKSRLQRALVPGSDTFVNGIISQIQGIFDQAAAITEQLFGQRSARINFEGERYSLQTELVNFTRNLSGASEAIKVFTEALGIRQNNIKNQQSQSQAVSNGGGTVTGPIAYVGSTGIGSGPHLHIDGRNKDGSVMSAARLQQLQDLFYANGKPIDNYTMTSGYGPRKAPVAGASTNHLAFDYGIPEGTPITFKGQAVRINKRPNSGKGGNVLEITLESGEVIRLLHLQKFGNTQVVAKTNQAVNSTIKANDQQLTSAKIVDRSGNVYQQKNSSVPVMPASTIKLIVADLLIDQINQGKFKLDQTVNIPANLQGMGEKLGSSAKLSSLLDLMLAQSSNTATNALINLMGGTQTVNNLAKSRYPGTQLINYLNLPDSTTWGKNRSTANDTTNAMLRILNSDSEAAKFAENSLRKPRNFKFNGEVGGKIGNTSNVLANVGIVNIDGKEYIVTGYANVNGNDPGNRKIITNFTNDFSGQIKDRSQVSPVSSVQAQNNIRFGAKNSNYARLGELQNTLSSNPNFSPNTPEGRTALAVAMIIGAGESGGSWLKAGSNTNLFTAMGGAGNAMRGFAQFHTGYFNQQTDTQAEYINFLGETLSGKRALPRGKGKFNPSQLYQSIASGQITTEEQLLEYIQQTIHLNDWQGVHEYGGGGKRIRQSGVLTEALGFIRGGGTVATQQPVQQVAQVQPQQTVKVDPAAAELTDTFIKIRNRQLDLSDQAVRQDIEGLMINLGQTRESISRQFGDQIRNTSNQITDANNQFQDLIDQYSPQTQSSQLGQELRGLESSFRNFDNQLFEQERALTDNIRGLDGILKVIEESQPILDEMKASSDPAKREAARFAEQLKPQVEENRRFYSEQLKTVQSLRSQIPTVKANALDFVREGAEMRSLQAEIERMDQEIANYQQANNIEGERAIGILRTEKQLKLDIFKINQDFADNPTEAASRVETATKQAELKKKEIEYQYESKKLTAEINKLEQEGAILEKQGQIEKFKENQLLLSKKKLDLEILEIKKQYLDVAEQEYRIQLATEQAALRERQINFDYQNQLLTRQQSVRDFDSQILEGQASLVEFGGNPYQGATIREQNAFENENLRYRQQTQQLEQQYADNPELLDSFLQKAKIINELNLENIDNQFRDLGETVQDVAKSAFESFFEGVITGSKSIGEAFQDMATSVLQSIASIAAKMAVNALFGGKGFNFFSDGGEIPKVDNFDQGGTVIDALKREGPRGVLAVFTPGEEILSLKNGEAQRYQFLKDRFGKNPLKKLNLNFADGGSIESNLLNNLNVYQPKLSYSGNFGNNDNSYYVPSNQSVNITVVTPDVSGFQRSERQLGRMAAEYMNRY